MSLEHPHTPLTDLPAEGERPVKMWKPFNITVDEHYKFVPRHWCARFFSYLIKMIAAAFFACFNFIAYGFTVKGKKNFKGIHGGAVTICNHVQGMDCSLVVEAVAPKNLYYPTIKTNLELAFLRWPIKFCGGIPIPESPKALRVFNGVIQELLKRGNYVHVYPEGVLFPYYLKGIRQFHRGAFKYAYDAGVPVVPMVITFRERRGLRKLTNRKPLISMTVLEPVYPDTSKHARAEIERLMFVCYEKMADFFDEHSMPVPPSKGEGASGGGHAVGSASSIAGENPGGSAQKGTKPAAQTEGRKQAPSTDSHNGNSPVFQRAETKL